jgi:hypothetical protein
MIEVGVDNIITDKPDAIQNWLQAWNELSGTEKIALWLRNLFLQTTLENITLWLRNLFLQDDSVLGTEPLTYHRQIKNASIGHTFIRACFVC